jgi:uncharacterized protein (DUF58 family)
LSIRSPFRKMVRGRLTRAGWIIVIILLLLLVSAWNTGENLLYIVFGCLLGMLFLSFIAGRRSLKKVSVQREVPYAVYREEPFSCMLQIKNHKRFIPAISVRIEQEHGSVAYVLRIPARHQITVSLQSTMRRRGIFKMPSCELITRFPFGFLELRRRYSDALEVMVYPKIRPARLPALESSEGIQPLLARVNGDGDEFFSLRDYIRGDDLRLIVWRVSARMGKWMVREMGMGNARIITFVLDTRKGAEAADEATFEEMIDMTASLMITLLKRQYSVGLYTPDHVVPCGKGTAQEQYLLDCLTGVNPVDGAAWQDFDQRVQRLKSDGMRLILVSADTAAWGYEDTDMGLQVLDPGNVIYA